MAPTSYHFPLKAIDPGGYRWPPNIPLAQNSYFRLAIFQVPNFRGRFEALNDVFLGITWARRCFFVCFCGCLSVLKDGHSDSLQEDHHS